MPRDVQFLTLVSDLKADLTLSTNVAEGPDYLPTLKRAIKRAYAELHRIRPGWAHLRRKFAPVALVAGQRYYDAPINLDLDRIEDVKLFWKGGVSGVTRGIGLDDYSAYDSTAGERSDPVLKWDVTTPDPVLSGASLDAPLPPSPAQIEVWPVPASSGGSLRFTGLTRPKALVNDIDTVDLDSDLVLLFAAASLLPIKDGERSAKMKEAQAFLAQLRADAVGPTENVRYGSGDGARRGDHPVVRVT